MKNLTEKNQPLLTYVKIFVIVCKYNGADMTRKERPTLNSFQDADHCGSYRST